MIEFLLLLAPIFAFGLLRGGGVCAVICAPGLFPLITSKKRTAWEGLKIGLLFNLPRIALLAVLGAIVGYISFTLLVSAPWFQNFIVTLGQFSYILFGIILVIVGAVMYARTADRRAQLKEQPTPDPMNNEGTRLSQVCSSLTKSAEKKSCQHCPQACQGSSDRMTGDDHESAHHPVWFRRILPATMKKRESVLVLIWGALLGTACMAEISVLSLELPAFSTIMGSYGANSLMAALYGGIAMAIFGLGASIPILLITTAAGQVSKKVDTESHLLALRTIGAVIMIMVGLVLVFSSFQGLIFL